MPCWAFAPRGAVINSAIARNGSKIFLIEIVLWLIIKYVNSFVKRAAKVRIFSIRIEFYRVCIIRAGKNLSFQQLPFAFHL